MNPTPPRGRLTVQHDDEPCPARSSCCPSNSTFQQSNTTFSAEPTASTCPAVLHLSVVRTTFTTETNGRRMVKLRAARSKSTPVLYERKEDEENVWKSSECLQELTQPAERLPDTRIAWNMCPDSRAPSSRGRCVKNVPKPTKHAEEGKSGSPFPEESN